MDNIQFDIDAQEESEDSDQLGMLTALAASFGGLMLQSATYTTRLSKLFQHVPLLLECFLCRRCEGVPRLKCAELWLHS